MVYRVDPRDRKKQTGANEVFDNLLFFGWAVLSVQCLTEFYSSVTRRLPERMPPDEAVAAVNRLSRLCLVLDLTPAAVMEGCRCAAQLNLHLWDAMIWAVAKLNHISYVLTEDAEHGRFLEGVRYLNPFDPSFDMGLFASS